MSLIPHITMLQVCRKFVLCTLVFFVFNCCMAQDNVSSDTTSTFVDSMTVPSYEENSYEDEDNYKVTDSVTADTAVFRSVADTTVNRLKKEKTFAYANDPAYWTKEKEKPRQKGFWDYVFQIFGTKFMQVLIYAVLIGVLLFALYRILVSNNMYLFYSSKKRNKKNGQVEFEREIDDDNLDTKIMTAIKNKEYRMAVRYSYLRTLQLLDKKGWIGYHPQATNYEYIKQVGKHTSLNDFSKLTHAYEYVWYGEFQLNEQQFEMVHNRFQKFNANLN